MSPTLRGPGSCHWELAGSIRVTVPVMEAWGGAPKSAREIKGDFPEVAVPQMGRVGVLQKNRHVGKACLVRGMAYEKAQVSPSCLGNHEPPGVGGP